MKTFTLLLMLSLALAGPTFAAKGGKGRKGEVRELMKAADANRNRKIDPDELTAFNEAFAKLSSESRVKRMDRNGDGKLSDDEIKRLNERLAKRAEGRKKSK